MAEIIFVHFLHFPQSEQWTLVQEHGGWDVTERNTYFPHLTSYPQDGNIDEDQAMADITFVHFLLFAQSEQWTLVQEHQE